MFNIQKIQHLGLAVLTPFSSKVTETCCAVKKLSHAVIKPSHSGFFVIHSVGRGDKTESLSDKTESLSNKPRDLVGRSDFFYSLGGMRRDAERCREKSFVR
jgi:hypothetical protein